MWFLKKLVNYILICFICILIFILFYVLYINYNLSNSINITLQDQNISGTYNEQNNKWIFIFSWSFYVSNVFLQSYYNLRVDDCIKQIKINETKSITNVKECDRKKTNHMDFWFYLKPWINTISISVENHADKLWFILSVSNVLIFFIVILIIVFGLLYFAINHHSLTKNQRFLIWFCVVIFIINCMLLFFGSDYKNYLWSDMWWYRNRALERYKWEIFGLNQWVIWPPMFHIILSNFFILFDYVGLWGLKLEIILIINIILFSISIYFIYLITKKLFKSDLFYVCIPAIIYWLCYPFHYFNVFILSENFAIPIYIIWFSLFVVSRKYFIASLLLWLTIIIRPWMWLTMIWFIIYYLLIFLREYTNLTNNNLRFQIFTKYLFDGLVFSVWFLIMIFIWMSVSYYISGWKIKWLSANGWINYYFSWCDKHRADFKFNNIHYILVPPSNVDKKIKWTDIFNKAPFESDYFYAIWEECKKNIDIFKNITTKIYNFFLWVMFPSLWTVLWFDQLFNIYRYIHIFMFIYILVSILFIYRLKWLDIPIIFLLYSIIILNILVIILFNSEHRYFYPNVFALYILFTVNLIIELVNNSNNNKKMIDHTW